MTLDPENLIALRHLGDIAPRPSGDVRAGASRGTRRPSSTPDPRNVEIIIGFISGARYAVFRRCQSPTRASVAALDAASATRTRGQAAAPHVEPLAERRPDRDYGAASQSPSPPRSRRRRRMSCRSKRMITPVPAQSQAGVSRPTPVPRLGLMGLTD